MLIVDSSESPIEASKTIETAIGKSDYHIEDDYSMSAEMMPHNNEMQEEGPLVPHSNFPVDQGKSMSKMMNF